MNKYLLYVPCAVEEEARTEKEGINSFELQPGCKACTPRTAVPRVLGTSDDRSNKMEDSSPLRLLQWEVTNVCNLSCSFCYASADMKKNEHFTTTEEERIIEGISQLEPRILQFIGGEPLLEKETILKTIERTYNDVEHFVITTNGTQITEEFLESIAPFKDKVIMEIAVDGPDKETHNELRGKCVFKQVMDGIDLINKKGLRWGANYLFTQNNLEELSATVDMVDEKGGEFMQILQVGEVGRGESFCTQGALTEKDVEIAKEQVIENKKNTDLEPYSKSFLLPETEKKAEKIKNNEEYIFGCGAGVERIMVLYTNSLGPCSAIREGELVFDLDGPLVDIYEKLQKRYLTTVEEYKKEKCGSCLYLDKCHPRTCQVHKDGFIEG